MLSWAALLPGYKRVRERLLRLEGQVQWLEQGMKATLAQMENLAAGNAALRGEIERLGHDVRGVIKPPTWVPPGHFYSPLVDPEDEVVQRKLQESECGTLPDRDDLKLDIDLIRDWLVRISSHYPQAPFSAERQDGLRYYYQNPAFSYGDALVYFGVLLELKPQRLVEVGSGYSSCVAMDTNDRFLGGKLDLTFIDPYPETLSSLLDKDDPYRQRIMPNRLQDVPTEAFAALGPGDILFIDSSHVGKTGSDVNDYLFRILPALQPGVVVHIHDIPYPFEYGRQWIKEENRSWNEAYLLRAFLQYNTAFRTFYFNHFVYRRFPDLLEAKMPLCLKDCGASIWLEKVRDSPMTGPLT